MDSVPVDSSRQRSTNQLILKNTLLLVGAKIVAMPISVVTNAFIARHLGPSDYSYIYLATTYTTFGMLFVVFGQGGALPALVAVDRERAGDFLGGALAWRAAVSVAVYALLAVACMILGYGTDFQMALALVFVAAMVTAFAGACLEVIRGFERTDVDAYANVGTTLLTAAITIPLLLLGGRLAGVLGATVIVAIAVVVFVSRFLKPVGIGRLTVRKETLKTLATKGYPFMMFATAMTLQPVIDAAFLSKLSTPEVVGWHAAAFKLIGLVLFPATALLTALYPVLCRLFAEDHDSYVSTTRTTLQTSVMMLVPVSLGCALFPQLGLLVYGDQEFGPVVQNLRVFAAYVFLVYLSMPLGSAVLAAGRARGWSLVQVFCVATSLCLDPILVPYFQKHYGNGGLGICWSVVAAECVVVAFGLWMLPRGILSWGMLRALLPPLAGGVAMVVVAKLTSDLSEFIAVPACGIAYLACLWATGGFGREEVGFLKSVVARRKGSG